MLTVISLILAIIALIFQDDITKWKNVRREKRQKIKEGKDAQYAALLNEYRSDHELYITQQIRTLMLLPLPLLTGTVMFIFLGGLLGAGELHAVGKALSIFAVIIAWVCILSIGRTIGRANNLHAGVMRDGAWKREPKELTLYQSLDRKLDALAKQVVRPSELDTHLSEISAANYVDATPMNQSLLRAEFLTIVAQGNIRKMERFIGSLGPLSVLVFLEDLALSGRFKAAPPELKANLRTFLRTTLPSSVKAGLSRPALDALSLAG
ncbi:hypothetical protein KSP35_06990 [Aquihabitans sp. G128]|uniref:hypothetical protein n=1 Tax=Aquihabitans sp. G128 TaxID=2849779 RepID=UPI001C22FF17|nr:hypothetical protein [Aquihabitans sp. G128]QXC62537.1 hypothetical protein KSP35_06990 [Aquihabitans sp. G128]